MKKRLSLLKKLGFGLGIGIAVVASILITSQFHNVKSGYALTGSSYIGPNGGDFNTAANWSPSGVPTAGTSILLPAALPGGTTYTLNDDLAYALGSITVDTTGSNGTTAGVGAAGSAYVITGTVAMATGSQLVDASGNVTTVTIATLTDAGSLTVDGNNLVTVGSLSATTGLAVSSPFTATSISTGTLSGSGAFTTGSLTVSTADNSTGAYTVSGTYTYSSGTNLAISHSITVGTLTLSGAANLTISGGSPSLTTVTDPNNMTISGGTPAALTTLNVTGTLTASTAFTAGAITAGTLTGSAAFTATSITAGTLNTSGAFTTTTLTVSTADTATNSYTVNGTYTYSPATLLTVSQAIHVGTLTVSTGSLTINTNFSNQPTAINVPAGTLTASVAFTAGTVTASTLTGSGAFTATSITAGTLNTSGAFTTTTLTVSTVDTSTAAYTVTGLYTFNGATLNVAHAITVGNLTVTTGTLTMSSSFIVSTGGTITVGGNATISYAIGGTPTVNVTGALTVSTSSFSATAVTAGSLTMTQPFTVVNTLTVNSALTVSQNITVGTLTVNGNLTETNNYTAATVNVTGSVSVLTTNNSYSFEHKYIVSGTLAVGNSNGSNGGNIFLADGTNVTGVVTVNKNSQLYQTAGASITLGSLVVQNGANVTLDGTVNYPVTFGSGASQVSPVLAYNVATGSTDSNGNAIYNTLEFKGATTLLNDLQLQIGGNAVYGTVNFSGPITYNGFGITTTSSDGTLLIGGVQAHNPGVTNTYTGNLPGDSLNINDNETAIITGTRGYVYGYRGSMVKGTGTVLGLNLSYGAAVTPGNSPGTLTALNWLYMQQTSVYNVELKSTSAYDQLAVGSQYDGSSNSGSAVVLHNNPILNVSLLSGYSMANGDKFTIINNQSNTPVSGIFNGLTEGSTFKVSDGTFSISYVGGDGNDVVLTVISAPSQPVTVKAPNTGVQFLTTHPVLLVVLGGITAGFFLVLAIRRRVTQ